MSTKTKALTILGGAVAAVGLLLGAPTAGADPGGKIPGTTGAGVNWGQEVKDCKANSCYPGGSDKRGSYVKSQTPAGGDTEGPGYGREIHDWANPGASAPKGGPLN